MNIVMQLRKVCNHPNLFEPRSVQTPFCVETESFRPFCRQILVNRDKAFEEAVLHLNDLDNTLRHKRRLQETNVERTSDPILDSLRQEMTDRMVHKLRQYKEEWTSNSLKKYSD